MIRLIYISIFLFSNIAHTATKALMPTDKLPRELIYLTESLQELQFKDIDKTKSNDEIFKKLEKSFQNLSKEELYFISKSVIYKTVLRFRPTASVKDEFFQKDILEKTDEKLAVVKLNSFSHWLLKAIQKDLKDLFESRHYPTFIAERNKGAISSKQSRKMQSKMNFLLPWIQGFLNEEPELFQLSLIPLMNESIAVINEKMDYLALYADKSEAPSEPVQYFEEQSIQLDKSGRPVSVEDILDPLLSKYKNKNLPVPVDDWIGEEDDFAKSLTPMKEYTPKDDYKAPEKLPSPVDEW